MPNTVPIAQLQWRSRARVVGRIKGLKDSGRGCSFAGTMSPMKRAFGAAAIVLLLSLGIVGPGFRASWGTPRTRDLTLSAKGVRPLPSRAVRAISSSCPAPAGGALSQAPDIPGGNKTVALTFDDGPGPSSSAILSILESFGVRATFFNIGLSETRWPAEVRAEAAAGYLIGDHTGDHPQMTALSAVAQAAEMDRVIQEQQSLVGSSPCVFRPPYGDYNSTTLSLAHERHMPFGCGTSTPRTGKRADPRPPTG